MSEDAFPQPISDVVATLAEIYRHRNQTDIVELLESANADAFVNYYDRIDGGLSTWTLRLQVPVVLFASAETNLAFLEKELVATLRYIGRQYPHHSVGEVTIAPLAPGAAAINARTNPSERQVEHLWRAGRFRLFLSHKSEHRAEVGVLKQQLAWRGIAAFVAHEDIEPSLEWQQEIVLALRSMHALAALITPDFHASEWTDHEVGWALGRGTLVIPVGFGKTPYGLFGKFQSVPGDFAKAKQTAIAILNILLRNAQTHGEMRRSLVRAFTESESFEMSLALIKAIVKVKDFTDEEKAALRRACKDNSNVARAFYVPETITQTFGPPAPKLDEDVPF